eukprot:CAMPEP_0201880470 /NCGR_PEP_ID=MMETSP0902-20130614/11038_1 /ASSEMBLY_ACC=CAM_ASM_000551 /TAXON_ID=420261 /ORGANISM="Thalassiosira antarctica, Strain CCMP982" /LENGTH=550 /DNA_ID=CAMNT_0048408479 /DNA_START=18 /DNA_END=1670 /DNA_ORIENTATION=-
MSNLSELSIQLRKLQSEKNAHANEIDRLQRQVRILSELKGISISDLQEALRAACEDEAHGELRALVGKLQAKVDGLELGGGGVRGRRRANGGNFDDDDNNISMLEQFDQEAAARARTTLELRIGELEEIELTLRAELDSLYKNSQKFTERNTFLETQLLQQKAQLEQWERRWKAKEEEEMRRSSIVPMAMPATGSYNYSEFATSNNDASASQPILLHNAPQSQVDTEHEQRLLAAEAALIGEKQQRSLVQSQLSSAQKSYELKLDHYQHRIQFLEEQLHDLEQQLSSLYAAFGMMESESNKERNQKEAWKRTLIESDTAIAKEETKRERNQQFSPNGSNAGQRPTPKSERSSRRMLTKLLSPPLHHQRPQSNLAPPKAAVKPAAHPPIAKGILLLLLDKDDQPLSPNHAPSTPRQKSFSAKKLLPKSSSNRKNAASSASALNFTKQYCVLHGANGLYQLRYGDTYTGPVSGVHEFITADVSSIDHSPRSSSQPFGFEIMINATVMDAPVLCCAAEGEDDFLMWMSALTSVIDGSMDGSGNVESALARQSI